MTLVIALDLMGGDNAPEVAVEGAAIARARFPDLRFLLFGDEAKVRPHLAKHPDIAAMEFVHTSEFVAGDAKPSLALRQGRQSSMRLAINAVKDGSAAAAVSAGNTGALMAMAKFVLKTLPGIDRPAIAGPMPTSDKTAVVLDLGANVDCGVEHLVQFAVMGHVFARIVTGVADPKIGLLNIGTEDLKGSDEIRSAAAILRSSSLAGAFYGFVEGTDVTKGVVDVVVTDGFTGNVALKIAEGTASMYSSFLRTAFRSDWRAKLGYLLAKPALDRVRTRLDPRRYNGAMLLGLNGVVVKSHGGTDAVGFGHAIGAAVELVRAGANERIIEEMTRMAAQDSSAPAAAVG
ncbi:MAG TPA: phosphate acyltransferase PlsX [Geminicoccus sp.]|jgi:glycerol-3-phosphate acyltransferase PlsX|uniref:phosphate acyltransferase PlsX n=1 Tax=Geminicoccus sp. TaxID=2024832 RepID=UPI002E352BD9|nr:phosphate acyltransferase PlsX [Geminicoccus sp.]HEX2525539.1 phosphate acyltransferase PlsX [Geminicoccus sp.]